MPEGNEIHRWAERHFAAFGGRFVRVDGPQGRFTDTAVINGRKLERGMAAGKHLGDDFGRDRILHVHLGRQGGFTEGSGALPGVKVGGSGGNVCGAELVDWGRLNPFPPGKEVEERTLRSIWKDAGVLMKAAMVDRRIVTARAKDRPHKRGPVLKEETHYVYRRQGRLCF